MFSGGEAATITAFQQAQENKEFLIGYFWEPQYIHAEVPMEQVALPPYEDGCQDDPAKVACDYPETPLKKFVSTEWAESDSTAVDLVRNFNWTNEDQNQVAAYITPTRCRRRTPLRSGSRRTRTRSTPGSPDAGRWQATRKPPSGRNGMTDIRERSSDPAGAGEDPPVSRSDKAVFGTAAVLSLAFVAIGAIWPEKTGEQTGEMLGWVTGNFGWLFVLTSAGFVLFSAYLAISRYGNIKLGPDDSEPEFSTPTWVAMMFATGMGIGLMFWGVAEPLTHLNAPPLGGAEPGSPDAAIEAMQWTFFHWGFHPWAMYAVIGLAIGYFAYRKGFGNLISAHVPAADR